MKYLVGIDPGTKTGFTVISDEDGMVVCTTTTIVKAQQWILKLLERASVEVWFEDSRLRAWFGSKGREALQGAGSIKRDCSVWEEFCQEYKIAYRCIAPQHVATKINAKSFRRITGWPHRTSEHARDSAMLVFGHSF